MTIRLKIITISVFAIAGLFLLLLAVGYGNSNIKFLHEMDVLIHGIEIDVLNLRRNEKDFMSRKDMKYVANFKQSIDELQRKINTFSDHSASLGIDKAKIDQLSTSIGNYQKIFSEIVVQVQKIGLKPDEGLRGQLRSAVHDAETKIKEAKNNDLLAQMLMLRRHEKDFILRKKEKYIDRHQKLSSEFAQELQKQEQSNPILGGASQKIVQYSTKFTEMVEAEKRSGLTQKNGMLGKLRETAHQTEAMLQEASAELQLSIKQFTENQQWLMITIGIVISGIVLGISLVIAISTSKRLKCVVQSMQEVVSGDGDLTRRTDTSGNDELSEIATSFNQFAGRISDLLLEVFGVVKILGDVSENSQEVGLKTSENAKQQQQATSEMSASVEVMIGAIGEVCGSVASMNEACSSAGIASESGKKMIAETGAIIGQLSEEISKSADVVSLLKGESNNIGSVLDVITGIADQTNLLALNAAIEAARAGESGRGFAVVADEVRTLAQRTQESTEEIRSIIGRLQNGVSNMVKAMESSQEKTSLSVDKVNSAIESLAEVATSIETISSTSDAISSQAAQQSESSQEINKRLDIVNDEAAATAECTLQSLRQNERIEEVSGNLEKLVNQFKLS